MKHVITSMGLVVLTLSACHHTEAVSPDPIVAAQHEPALEQFAIAAVYEARPTRALVDSFEVISTKDEVSVVRVEMTGSPTARNIYQLMITELEAGEYELEAFEILQ